MESATASRAAPVSDDERLPLLDLARGVALLGILLMNIDGFAFPRYFTEPFKNDPGSVDFWALLANRVVFEGKMRALFGMVFGAGVYLFVSRKAERGHPAGALFLRRMLWLVLFGVVHAWLLLWWGDILYLYGLCGLLVYALRRVPPRLLLLGIPLVALRDFTASALWNDKIRDQRIAYLDARQAEEAQRPLSPGQAQALTAWRELEKTIIPNRAEVIENTRKMRGDYASVAARVRMLSKEMETTFVPLSIPDSVALMLLGVALLRMGFLAGEWSTRAYRRVMAIGYGLGVPLVLTAHFYYVRYYPNHEAYLERLVAVPIDWMDLAYPFQRILLVMGHVSALILLQRSGALAGLVRRLQAVGRMAFSNYIFHTVACTLVFYGYGLGLYGRLAYHQAFYVILAIWVFQLAASPWWLARFRFGPLEWLWRSLTYWEFQPLRRPAPALAAAS
jgi:uncharacterized protein